MIAQWREIPVFRLHTRFDARLCTWCCLTHFLSHKNVARRFIFLWRSGCCGVAGRIRLLPQAGVTFHAWIRRKSRRIFARHPYVSALRSETYAWKHCDKYPKHIVSGSILGWTEGARG
jgi:hypothetical protein